jgi:putative ABC transport system permease protein
MDIREVIGQSKESLVRNRLRSILTMLGIVWGLSTVVLLLGYGESVSRSVLHAFMGIGNNVIMCWGGQTSMQAGGERAGKRINFRFEDIQAVRDDAPLVRFVSGEIDNNFPFKYNDRVVSVSSKAVQFPYNEMRRLNVASGRYFQESDHTEQRHVVIFGPNAAKKVFGNRDPVGEWVTIFGQSWQVIGVLELKIQDSSNNGPDNENAFLPLESMTSLMGTRDPGMIVYQPVNPDQDEAAMFQVRQVLGRRLGFNPKDKKATPTWNTIENSREIMQFGIALKVVLGFIGALTLAVGGVGVMNIMLVSVTERTREIGLRKALGARKKDIASQFLLEAIFLTFVAGAVGMIFATLLAHAIPPMPLYSDMYKTANNEGDIILRTSSTVMITSFLILTIVGVFSGMWPAMKAAALDPVEALRHE